MNQPKNEQTDIINSSMRAGTIAKTGAIVFLVSILLLANSSNVAGQNPTVLRFLQTDYSAVVDSSLVVDLMVDDVEQLGAWEVTVQFDPAFLSLTTVTPTEFLTSTGRQVEVLGPSDTGVAGELRVGAFSYGTAESVSGSGVLAEIQFEVHQEGETMLQLGDAVLATSVMGEIVELTPQVNGATVDISPNVVLEASIDIDQTQQAILISWQTPPGAAYFEVLRAERPYINRGDGDTTDISSSCNDNGGTITCTDLTGGGGHIAINHYYLISVYDQSSQLLADHRLAEFDVPLSGAG